jgi:hypothetical protein
MVLNAPGASGTVVAEKTALHPSGAADCSTNVDGAQVTASGLPTLTEYISVTPAAAA